MDVKYSELGKKRDTTGERAFIHSFIHSKTVEHLLFRSVGHAKMNKT